MKILCIDTSSTLCSVAILENDILLDKSELDTGLTHSETLLNLIKNLLEKNNISLKDINLLVCDIGPGSFTGIRIGVATAKAFSDSLHIPCIGINALEILAYNFKDNGLICSTIDCKNDNCYFALYELIDQTYNILEAPCAKSSKEVLNLLETEYKNKVINFVGNGIPDKSTDYYLNVENLGIAGYKKFTNNNFSSEEILPLYLKKPQAEIQLEEKLKNKTKEFAMKIDIRKMDLKDFDRIKTKLDDDFDNFWTHNILESELKSKNSYFIVATIDDKIVGFAGLKIVLDQSDVMNIVVRKDQRQNGIGSIMLEYLIEYSKSLNLKTITLEVNENNLSAIRLYNKFNFDHIGIRKKYYRDNSDAIIMSKQL